MYREDLRDKWREVEKVYMREDQEYSNDVFVKKFCTELGRNITSDLINDFSKAMENILKSGNQGEEDIYRIFLDTIDSFGESIVSIEDYLTVILKVLDRVSTNKWEIRNSHEYATSFLLVKALTELVIYEPNVKQMKPCTSHLLTCGIKMDKINAEIEKLARLLDERDNKFKEDILRGLIVIAVQNCIRENTKMMLSNCITFMRLLDIPVDNIQKQVAKYGLAMSMTGYLVPEESNRIEGTESIDYELPIADIAIGIENMINQNSKVDLNRELTDLDLRINKLDTICLSKELWIILRRCSENGLAFS